jgi:hypothetical protein
LLVAALTVIVGSTAYAAAGAAAPAKEQTPAVTTPATTPAPTPVKTPAPAAPTHTEAFCPELLKTLHDPAPWLHMGFDTRFRIEAGENMQTLNEAAATDHTYLYERYRSRWWTNWTLNEDISLNTRLVWETRTWQYPETRYQYTNPGGTTPPSHENPYVTDFNPDEALFDWFNVTLRNIGGMPLTATVGRQDMMFGVGWLVLDASPLDGSRTIGMFDAARFTYDWADAQTKVDAIYANNSPESDRWLNPINDQNRGLMEDEEQAAILYLTNTSWKPIQLEGFFIYKQDTPLDHVLSNYPYIWSEEGETYTFGAAISGTRGDHWKYRAEGAYQTGRKAGDLPSSRPVRAVSDLGETNDVQAFGTLDTLEYLFKDPHNNATHLTYEYASGDDPSTDNDERFDLLWGRWPRWSELFIFTYANETRIGDATNLHRLNVGHRVSLTKQWTVTGDYHALWADENSGALIPAAIKVSSDDKFRGSLLATSLRYKYSDQLSGYGLLEYLAPGSYYVAPSDDNAWFFRFNVEYVF